MAMSVSSNDDDWYRGETRREFPQKGDVCIAHEPRGFSQDLSPFSSGRCRLALATSTWDAVFMEPSVPLGVSENRKEADGE